MSKAVDEAPGEAAALVLYGCGSPNVFKVQLMLAETGLDYRFEAVAIYGSALDSPWFRALNPNGKLPVLVDGGEPIFESGAILLHLAERTGRYLAASGPARSRAVQWLMWQMSAVGPMFGQAAHFRYIAGAGNDYAAGRYQREVERLYGVLNARLGQAPFLAGDDYSIADIACFPWAARYAKTLGVALDRFPNVADWVGRIERRPAFALIDGEGKRLFKTDIEAQRAATPAELDRFFGRGTATRP